jgi:hypothetical protein
MQGLQDELPWPDSGRVTDQAGLARKECPHEVRNELIAGPIAAPNSIPGASAGNVVAIKRLGREDSVISSNLSCNSMACTNPICDYSQRVRSTPRRPDRH